MAPVTRSQTLVKCRFGLIDDDAECSRLMHSQVSENLTVNHDARNGRVAFGELSFGFLQLPELLATMASPVTAIEHQHGRTRRRQRLQRSGQCQ